MKKAKEYLLKNGYTELAKNDLACTLMESYYKDMLNDLMPTEKDVLEISEDVTYHSRPENKIIKRLWYTAGAEMMRNAIKK